MRQLVILLVTVSGCYLSHPPAESEDRTFDGGPQDVPALDVSSRDAGFPDTNFPPPDSGFPDASPGPLDAATTCPEPYVRSDLSIGAVRTGHPVEVGEYIVWMPNNWEGTKVAWFHRGTEELRITEISEELTRGSHLVATAEGILATWEQLGERGQPEGVFTAVLPRTPGPARNTTQVSPFGGRPQVAFGPNPEAALLTFQGQTREAMETYVAPVDLRNGEARDAPREVDDDYRVYGGLATAGERYFLAAARRVYELDPTTLEPRLLFTTGRVNFVYDLAASESTLVTGAIGGRVRAYTFDGDLRRSRDIPSGGDDSANTRVAARGNRVLASARIPGGAGIYDPELSLVFDAGPLPHNPELAPTSTGFVALGTRDGVLSDNVITFLDECMD